jgi:hypothetical protein
MMTQVFGTFRATRPEGTRIPVVAVRPEAEDNTVTT